MSVALYAFSELDGTSSRDIVASYDEQRHAIVAWSEKTPDQVRTIGCSQAPDSWEVTIDHGKAVGSRSPGKLSMAVGKTSDSPLGILHYTLDLAPAQTVRLAFQITVGANGLRALLDDYDAVPEANAALERTRAYYHAVLERSVVLSPNAYVNRATMWAKANMLRVQRKTSSGWGFTNSPTRASLIYSYFMIHL